MLEYPSMSNYYNNFYKIGLSENVMTADNQQERTLEDTRYELFYYVGREYTCVPGESFSGTGSKLIKESFSAGNDDEASRKMIKILRQRETEEIMKYNTRAMLIGDLMTFTTCFLEKKTKDSKRTSISTMNINRIERLNVPPKINDLKIKKGKRAIKP